MDRVDEKQKCLKIENKCTDSIPRYIRKRNTHFSFFKNKVYKKVEPQLASKTKNILYAEMEAHFHRKLRTVKIAQMP